MLGPVSLFSELWQALMTWFFQDHKWKIKYNTKPQASSAKPQAPIFRRLKQQASSPRTKGSSFKPQASSSVIREP
jgi:hypothetical protein